MTAKPRPLHCSLAIHFRVWARGRLGAQRRLLPALPILLTLLAGFAVHPASAQPLLQHASVHPLVEDTIAAQGQAEVLVLLRARADLTFARAQPTQAGRADQAYRALVSLAEASQADLRASLDAHGLEYQSFYIVNAIKVQADQDLLQALVSRPEVGRIVPNPWVKAVPEMDDAPAAGATGTEPNLLRVHADSVWALGYTGEGVVVAGADTGYDWDHPALQRQYRGWDGASADHDYNWHDAIHTEGSVCGADSAQPCDDHGHGTHTMGTLVGDDGAGNQIGMAPGAQWIGCRNMDRGLGSPATYLECFEFFLAPYPVGGTPEQGDPAKAPHVINNSWSCPPSEGCDQDTLEAAVDALRAAGIAVVVSAGNTGPACGSVDRPPTLYRGSFSVGAFGYDSDEIASFSSRGPVSYNGQTYIKPDITAPGTGIRSSSPGGGYSYSSGTSMAAPHVSGAMALLLSAAPELRGQVDAIESALTSTAEPRLDSQCGDPGPPNSVWGWGILDARAAVQGVTAGVLSGLVSAENTGDPIAGARVTATKDSLAGPGAETVTYTSGRYAVSLPAGVYTVSAEAAGFRAHQVDGVVITRGGSSVLDFSLQAGVYRIIILFGVPAEP